MSRLDLFEPGLVERLLARPDVAARGIDVYLIAADVSEWCARKPGQVKNANGMLVSRVNAALKPPATTPEAAAELDRYAEFQVTLYREISLEWLSPAEVAERLEAARANGYPKINAQVIARLRALGQEWIQEAEHAGA